MDLPKCKHFIPFIADVTDIELPLIFNNPLSNELHPIAELACRELQQHLLQKESWNINLGLNGIDGQGKMFGILVVKKANDQLGYLAAFSGKIENSNSHDFFVPPVFDTLDETGFYKKGELVLNELNDEVDNALNDTKYLGLKIQLSESKTMADKEVFELKLKHKERKKERDGKRKEAETLDEAEKSFLLQTLKNESSRDHFEIKDVMKKWKDILSKIESDINEYEENISKLKIYRKEQSAALQYRLFEKYNFLNQQKESKNLLQIFADVNIELPPAGAGECAAPKLLQYAFANNLTPLSIAEFWWGKSPASEIRKHAEFYGSCSGKCKPILKHMLGHTPHESFEVEDNKNAGKAIDIVYEDEHIAIINKPHELLSVPGRRSTDSVLQRMKEKYPNASGPLIVHRLDMSTSGLMIIAKDLKAYQRLQSQFIKRKVRKKYIAILNGTIKNKEGEIDLPLRVDLDNRPHQLVCYEHGKPAKTNYEVLEEKNGKTKILFIPVTGRTHQLRVHSAHPSGLNTAIYGDDMYGKIADRLYLQAQAIEFYHPESNEVMQFELEHEF